MEFIASGARFKPKEVGYFSPDLAVAPEIKDGEIGYIATGLKDPALVKIGDTVLARSEERMTASDKKKFALAGLSRAGAGGFHFFLSRRRHEVRRSEKGIRKIAFERCGAFL